MLTMRVTRILPAVVLALAACSAPPRTTESPASASTPAGRTAPTGHYDIKADPAADLTAAIARATAEKKRILVVVGGEWCSWCHILDSYLETNADVQRVWDERYVTFFVNWSEENKNDAFLSRYPKITGYPHIFVLDTTGALLHSQDTALLEEGRSYSKAKMQEFLDRWRLTT